MATNLACSQNAAIAYDFLAAKGLSAAQAAAVVGNLQWESKLNPRLEAMDTDGFPHRGIAMWDPHRWQNLLTFGSDPWALDTQLAFLWHELETDPSLGLRDLLATTTVEGATIAFQNGFEKPRQDAAHTDRRIALANDALTCLSVRPPTNQKRVGSVVTALGVLSLAAAAGYGAYKFLPVARRA